MKSFLFVILFFSTSMAWATNYNCQISLTGDLDQALKDAFAIPAQMKIKKTGSGDQVAATIKIKAGKEKAKYNCSGTQSATELKMYCLPSNVQDPSAEDYLLVNMAAAADGRLVGTAYVNDGDDETEPNLNCQP